MSIQIKAAETAEELDQLFRVRHEVYVEEGGYMPPNPDGRIYDRFDAYPSTKNLIALHENQIVGGLRLTETTGVGLPAHEFFDFARHLPQVSSGKMGCISMYCAKREYQKAGVGVKLLRAGHDWAILQQWSYITNAANPEVLTFSMLIGYMPLASQLYDPNKSLPFVPIVLDLNQPNDRLHRFLNHSGREQT